MPPLDGLRVVDLTRVVAGPFCTMMLGDMGAEVLKIEEPKHGDDSRAWAPFINGTGSFFLALNRSKKSVALDLKTPDGAEALRRLVETADVLIENFRPGSLAELGFDYAVMAALNPRLIYCSISGYGQTGPSSLLAGYDAVIQGKAGTVDRTGAAEGAPTRVGVAITDYLAGLYAIQGILLALIDRERSGLGQHVDIALFEAMLSVMRLPLSVLQATGSTPTRVGNDHLNIAPYEPLRAKDGLLIVAVANPGLWGRFCDAIDRPALAGDPRFSTNTARVANRQALKDAIEAVFKDFTVDELTARFATKNVPCGRVRSISEAITHPQVAARGLMITPQEAPSGTIESLAPVVRLSRTPAEVRLAPPVLGEHTADVLADLKSRV
jgi:crotonobetainyl-CoA:carnitine CoA-transferase CaiB-like acyl-CoA transferase